MSFGCKIAMALCNVKIFGCLLLVLTSAASLPTKAPRCHISRSNSPTFNWRKSLHFNCSITHGGASMISWKINGTIVKKTQRPVNWLGLLLSDKSNSGILQCEAKTKMGDVSCEVKLTDFPRITTRVHFYEVFVDDRLVVPCKSTGSPKPSLTWSKRNKVLHETTMPQSITLQKSGDGLDLVIQKASNAHDDVYVCRAVNALGQDTHHAVVSVLLRTVQRPPRAVPLTQTITVKYGSNAFLACTVNNTPEKYTAFSWDFHGRMIQTSKRLKTEETFSVILQNQYKIERAVMSLAISHVTFQDAGVYKCSAANHVGHDQALIKLVVEG